MALLSFLISFVLVGSLSAQESLPNNFAVIKTSMGDIRVKLYNNTAPKTVNNFVGLSKGTLPYKDANTGKKVANKAFYKDMIFHKIHPTLGIQTGCPWGTGKGWPGFTIKDEINRKLKFDRPFLVAMAKIDRQPDSAGSQFFITTKAQPHLDGQYTIFGEVVSGYDVVKQISRQPRDAMMKPLNPIKMSEIVIE